jgi:predicted aspartyl protease
MKRLAIFLSMLALGATAARADDCALKLINTLPLTMTDNGLAALVPVHINGQEKLFLLDTGGAATQISVDAIKDLNLRMRESNIKLLSLGGSAAEGLVKVDTFALGKLQDRNAELLVSPFRFGGDPPVAGILAGDYMARYDLEFNFADGKLNYMSPEHCTGKVVYWNAPAVAVVPMKFIDHHLRIEVELNGKKFRAIIDTGATDTTLTAGDARRVFNLTEDSPGVRQLSGSKGQMRFEKIFDTLTFDGIAVGHPHITVLPELIGRHDANNSVVTGTRLQHADDPDPTAPTMLIGMNILTKLRFYVAFSENKIYLTPATPRASVQ